MDLKQLIKRISGPGPVITVCTLLLLLLSFLIVRSLDEQASGHLHFWITVIGTVGIGVLIFFLFTNIYSLLRQFNRKEIGSRLTSKLVLIFFFLTVVPFSLIYYFSIQFLNRGIDSWFDVRIEQAVKDARLLGQSSLEAIRQEIVSDVDTYAENLSKNLEKVDLLRALEDIRELGDFAEVSIYTLDGRIIAFSSNDPTQMLPNTPVDDVFSQLAILQTYTSLEPMTDNTQQLRVVAPVKTPDLGRAIYALQAIKLLPLRYANLASSVESALNQYDQMVFARGPLKFSLILTLSIISLASLLFSVLTAVYLSRRMVAPISELAAGTRKIAAGDYGTTIPVTTADEFGILIDSFNNMSKKVDQAQHEAISSQREMEEQKGYLEAVLTNLSSGVLAFDTDMNLDIVNSAACDILGVDLRQSRHLNLADLSTSEGVLKDFFSRINQGIESDNENWEDEINLLGPHGRQLLIIRGSLLHTTSLDGSSHVIVFDDVTKLIQAQRDAAWGEVARRLAHEIKNPLTPIQLSAERIHAKFSDQVSDDLKPMLERTTRTIVQQVESMKEMVNAFSSYAQPVRAQLAPLDVNRLLRDVVELHSSQMRNIQIDFQLNDEIPQIKANASALRQVFNNLIINAQHALEDKADGKITLITENATNVNGQYIDIRFEDNGSGIPDDIKDAIFDPYVSSKSKGSGLGLAIVKRIVEEHSGSVRFDPERQTGACIHIRLPVSAQQTYRGNRTQNTLHSGHEPS